MSTSISPRVSGVLVAWRLSKSGGFGRVLADNKNYFICRKFITEGVPIVGSPLTFEVAPPMPGKLFPRAINVKINNRQIVRAMELPAIQPVPIGDGPNFSNAVAILSGADE
jgi:hypothetical protein